MKCQAAILRGVGHDWEVQEITLDPPRDGEVLVKMAVAGICHSDEHFTTGDMIPTPGLAAMMEATGAPVPEYFPFLGGHEGAGVVEEVGPGVRSVQPGDHVGDVVHARMRILPVVRVGHDLSLRQRGHALRQGDGRPTAPRAVTSATRI